MMNDAPTTPAERKAPIQSISGLMKFKSQHDLDLDTHISLKNRYVYLMVSKAASSTVTYHLQYVEYKGSRFSVQNVNSRYMSPHIAPFQLSRRRFVEIMNDPAFRKVTVVRNPYTRLLSCYLHRIVGIKKTNPSKRVLAKYVPKESIPELTFEQFVDIVAGMENGAMERHWALQHDAIMYPVVNYDFIGRQETLQEDMVRMEQLLFGKKLFDRDALATVNKAPMQTGSSSRTRDYYTDRIAAKVAERYRRDFETFGYSTDLPE